jgi:hypothetical protein
MKDKENNEIMEMRGMKIETMSITMIHRQNNFLMSNIKFV